MKLLLYSFLKIPNFNLSYQVIAAQFQWVSVQKVPNLNLSYQVIAL